MDGNTTLRFAYTSEAEPFFREKVLDFHELMVDELIMFGTGKNNDHINNISICHIQNDSKIYTKIVAGMLESTPVFHVFCLNDDNTKHAECAMFYISTPEIEDWYMIQNIYDFPSTGKSMVQIWRLKLILPSHINAFWRD